MSKNELVAKREVQLYEERLPSFHKDSALVAKIIKELGVGYYLANTLMYFASSNRKNQKIKEINKTISYLRELSNHTTGQKPDIWNKYPAYCVGSTFKDLSEVVQCEHQREDVENALICLFILSDLIQGKCEVF